MLILRPVAPRLVAALGAVATLSCSGLLGIDDEQGDVARELCNCEGAIQSFGDASCEDHIAHRLEIATPATRAAWMEKFDEFCAKGCPGCWEAMFTTRPTCTDNGDDCANASCNDCCTDTSEGAGQCVTQ
jgi:hypothetical protein